MNKKTKGSHLLTYLTYCIGSQHCKGTWGCMQGFSTVMVNLYVNLTNVVST